MVGAHVCDLPWRRAALAVLILGVLFALATASYPRTAAAPGDKVYWADPGAQKIQRADLDGSNVEDVLTGVGAFDLEIDTDAGKLYWSEAGDIHRANLNGTAAEVVVAGGVTSRIALDLVHQKLYWADGSDVRRADLDGTSPATVFSAGSDVFGVDVDPDGAKIYYTIGGELQRVNLDGTGLESLATGFIFGDVYADRTVGKVFWIDGDFYTLPTTPCILSWGTIKSANFDGGSVQLLDGSPANSVHVHQGDLYWTQFEAVPSGPFPSLCGDPFGGPNVVLPTTSIAGVSPTSVAVASLPPPPVGGISLDASLESVRVGGSAPSIWLIGLALTAAASTLGGAWFVKKRA